MCTAWIILITPPWGPRWPNLSFSLLLFSEILQISKIIINIFQTPPHPPKIDYFWSKIALVIRLLGPKTPKFSRCARYGGIKYVLWPAEGGKPDFSRAFGAKKSLVYYYFPVFSKSFSIRIIILRKFSNLLNIRIFEGGVINIIRAVVNTKSYRM